VQLKKAQYMAPWDMKNVVGKVLAQGNERITLVERGSCFGYNRLVCDLTAIPAMQELGFPVLMDATHATQQPSGLGGASGGSPRMAKVLARAAVAAGADGLFLETHPQPEKALSDAACMIPLAELEPLLTLCRDLHDRVHAGR
jgi:2-dehydro-3-deoxyphosphooctonate aldolase (KDO 8-P synthase)